MDHRCKACKSAHRVLLELQLPTRRRGVRVPTLRTAAVRLTLRTSSFPVVSRRHGSSRHGCEERT